MQSAMSLLDQVNDLEMNVADMEVVLQKTVNLLSIAGH